jgi:hypothetical protein
MSQVTLRSVTLETVANYSHAAERAVGAYRAGGHRLIAVMQRGLDRAAARGADRLAPRLAAAIRRVGEQVGGFAGKGLDAVSTGTERAIEMSKAGFTAQVKRVAELADGIDNRAVVTGLQAAVKLSLPGAQAALAVSERVAAGADTVYGTVAGKQPAKAARRAAKPAKKARKAAAPVRRVSRKAAVKAAPAKVVRTRRAPKAAPAAAEAANA